MSPWSLPSAWENSYQLANLHLKVKANIKYKFISINKSLTHLQEGQFDGTEQPKVSLTQFQPGIDKSEHDN